MRGPAGLLAYLWLIYLFIFGLFGGSFQNRERTPATVQRPLFFFSAACAITQPTSTKIQPRKTMALLLHVVVVWN